MKKYVNKNGMTLIEVIVSLAILGIIFIVFLSMFTSGVKGIFFAGHRSKTVFSAQKTMEKYLNDGVAPTNPSVTTNITNHPSTSPFIINFNGISFNVTGKTASVTYSNSHQSTTITSFIPE